MKPKKKKARSEITKRRISESLTGGKLGGQEIRVDPQDALELRRSALKGDNFQYQELIDWYRSRGNL